MNFISKTVVVFFLCNVLVEPALSFDFLGKIKNFFSKDETTTTPIPWEYEGKSKEEKKAILGRVIARQMGEIRGTEYVTNKVYRSQSARHFLGDGEDLTIDLLLQRTTEATGLTHAYPFDYLICNNVKVTYNDQKRYFDLKSFDCKDMGQIPQGIIGKEIVAQAARSYAQASDLGTNYVVLRVLAANAQSIIYNKWNRVTVTLSMDLELAKPEKLIEETTKHSVAVQKCSNVVVQYSGVPKYWKKGKFVKIESFGNCEKKVIDLYL